MSDTVRSAETNMSCSPCHNQKMTDAPLRKRSRRRGRRGCHGAVMKNLPIRNKLPATNESPSDSSSTGLCGVKSVPIITKQSHPRETSIDSADSSLSGSLSGRMSLPIRARPSPTSETSSDDSSSANPSAFQRKFGSIKHRSRRNLEASKLTMVKEIRLEGTQNMDSCSCSSNVGKLRVRNADAQSTASTNIIAPIQGRQYSYVMVIDVDEDMSSPDQFEVAYNLAHQLTGHGKWKITAFPISDYEDVNRADESLGDAKSFSRTIAPLQIREVCKTTPVSAESRPGQPGVGDRGSWHTVDFETGANGAPEAVFQMRG